MGESKWVNIFYSDYHQDGFYEGLTGGDNGRFETEEDAKQYVIDNNVSNCVRQQEESTKGNL